MLMLIDVKHMFTRLLQLTYYLIDLLYAYRYKQCNVFIDWNSTVCCSNVCVCALVLLMSYHLTNENPIYFIYHCPRLIGIWIVCFQFQWIVWLIIFIFQINSVSHCIKSSARASKHTKCSLDFIQLHKYSLFHTVFPLVLSSLLTNRFSHQTVE